MEGGNHITLGPGGTREVEPTFFFMMNCLLYSRLESGSTVGAQDAVDDRSGFLVARHATDGDVTDTDHHRRARKNQFFERGTSGRRRRFFLTTGTRDCQNDYCDCD